ncbi:MAG: hypothetical protein DHS20C18_06560 [Saprospiraceae bacterium]|nr:MAG: hypothetical protein DHS20C18_06560 [Saprospiraceae bacterium]
MLTRILAFPFVVLALVFLYLTWEVTESYSVYIVGPVVALALIYVFSPQIDWWWYSRYPPKLDQRVQLLFQKQHSFYQSLSLEEKKRFRDRVALYLVAVEFQPQAMQMVPEDIKAILASCAVQLTLNREDFLLSKFENVVVYPHPFPSPQFPKQFHASEIFAEDGVLLFSAQHLTKGFMKPQHYYHIGLHEYAKVFLLHYPDLQWPTFEASIWEDLEKISRFSHEALLKYINLDKIDPLPVSITHFFVFPTQFREVLPEVYARYTQIFGWEPV